MMFIESFLDSITMYRLMLDCLIFFLAVAAILTTFNVLPFNFISLVLSVTILVVVCWITNNLFAKVFQVPTNIESIFITGLILALIITPLKNFHDVVFVFCAAVLAMASKYILVINKKHIFNPAALAVFLTSIIINQPASWWVGTSWMALFVLAGGILVVRKIRRFDLVWSFFLVSLTVILGASALKGGDLRFVAQTVILDTPILFFAFIMLTEPQTTPSTRKKQLIYGGLIGLLLALPVNLGNFVFTPETALLAGNIFSYLVSPQEKLILKLKEKVQIAKDAYDFVFGLDDKFIYSPGQYMEWTLGDKNPDSRGNRRYFTLASSPTEDSLRIGTKFYPYGSSFKKALLSMKVGDRILAGQLAGDFTLPKGEEKLVFIAGGIGITPFRSMVRYLLDTGQKRDIIIFYSNKTASDIAYKEIFKEAYEKLGIKTWYVLTDTQNIPADWEGKTGLVNEKMIKQEVSDFASRFFYISGPHSMVTVFEATLKEMGVPKNQIKLDFFPGYV